MVLCLKKRKTKKFKKTNIRFGFLDPNNPSVNPYKKQYFCKKMVLCSKKQKTKKFLKN